VDKIKINSITILLFIVFCITGHLLAQEADNNRGEWGGTTDIFDYPVGARAMALGGAYVSVVDDPYALYWNPAALENVQRVGFGIYHTTLSMSTDYNYFSFIYPTLTFGTFSAGMLRISTGNISLTEPDAAIIGEAKYSRSLFLFGYGFRPLRWFYMGTNFKVERTSLPNYEGEGNFTESALGADLGLLIKPQSQDGFFRNFAVGFNIQNFLQRQQRVIEVLDKTPRNFLFGLSKGFGSEQGANHFLLAYQTDISGNREYVPTFHHFGMEYDFNRTLFLRVGYDYHGEQADDVSGGKLTYGMGITMFGVQLDYSYWSPRYGELSNSHRISLIYNVGKTRKQRLDEQQAAELDRFKQEVERQRQYERRETIVKGMEQAQLFYENVDYPRAYSAINRVLALDETGNDPEFSKARLLLADINSSIEKQRDTEFNKELVRTREEAELKRKQQQVKEHYQKALAFFETEDYPEALRECDRALEIDPNSDLVRDLRKTVEEDLKKKITILVTRANSLERSGRQYDAIQYYNQAIQLANGNDKLEGLIDNKLRKLERRLTRDETLRRANEYEIAKDWEKASDLYKEALKFEPNNQSLQQKYNDMYARAHAIAGKLTGKEKDLYSKGFRAFNNGNYDEALKYYEQARELQPFNKTLLRAIDVAKDRKRAKQSAGSGK